MKVRVAYIEEPPFYWTSEDGSVVGSDIELARVVLEVMGVSAIEFHPTRFEALLPGVEEGRWDMNVPIFISAERAQRVAFSRPVWTLGDGFLLPAGNPRALGSYASLAAQADARLGTIAGTVQIGAARSASVGDDQMVVFQDQAEAVAALQAGNIDAFVGTAVGNRALAEAHPGLDAVAHDGDGSGKPAFGGFSFNKDNHTLLQAVNEQLQRYLGTADHRARVAKYGLTGAEIDGIL